MKGVEAFRWNVEEIVRREWRGRRKREATGRFGSHLTRISPIRYFTF